MAERGAHLRAIVNRKLVVDGEFTINYDRNCVVFPDFQISSGEGRAKKKLDVGDEIILRSQAEFHLVDVIAHVRANKKLYASGFVSGLPIVSPSDGKISLEFRFTAHKKIDLDKLDHLFELYLEA